MAKQPKSDVRDHSQEREWLRNLGNGNVVQGVQNLIQETKKEQSDKKNTSR